MTLTIDLPQELESVLKAEALAQGCSPADFAGQLLTHMLTPPPLQDFSPARKAEIRRQIEEGLQSLRAGEGIDGEEFFDRLERDLDRLERNGHK